MDSNCRYFCRLCGYDNNSEVCRTVQFLNFDETIGVAVNKYFGVMILPRNDDNVQICIMCYSSIESIARFETHVLKVNQIFMEFESNEKFSISDLKQKYGLNDETHYNMYDHQSENNLWPSYSKACARKIEKKLQVSNIRLKEDRERRETYSNNSDDISNKMSESTNNYSDCEVNKCKNINVNCGSTNLSIQNKINAEILQCEICNKIFRSAKGKAIHLKKKHALKETAPYKCTVCERIFKRLQSLHTHESTHLSETKRKYYNCPKCEKKFVNEWYVQDHIRIVHEGDKRYVCELCGAAFGTNKNLFDHQMTHSVEKKFHCSKCNKSFKCKRTLQFHIETHDDTEYPCNICGLKLNTKRILRRHMIVHSSENKYKCNFCSKQFKRQYEFKNHLLLHTGLKLYQCSFCELTFSNGSNCRKHQKGVHRTELENANSKDTLRMVENVPTFKQLLIANEEALIHNSKG